MRGMVLRCAEHTHGELCTSFSTVGRALDPFLVGSFFTIGAEGGYVIASWWLLAAIGIVGAGPVFFLVEGQGSSGYEEDGEIGDSVDEIEEEEAVLIGQGLGNESET